MGCHAYTTHRARTQDVFAIGCDGRQVTQDRVHCPLGHWDAFPSPVHLESVSSSGAYIGRWMGWDEGEVNEV